MAPLNSVRVVFLRRRMPRIWPENTGLTKAGIKPGQHNQFRACGVVYDTQG